LLVEQATADDRTFMAVEKKPVSDNCPPRVMIFKIINFGRKLLKLKVKWQPVQGVAVVYNNERDEIIIEQRPLLS
jgi:hypothetical protein